MLFKMGKWVDMVNVTGATATKRKNISHYFQSMLTPVSDTFMLETIQVLQRVFCKFDTPQFPCSDNNNAAYAPS